ncbi:MAG: hypothetical protein U1G08_03995 [Verrucomicrobiota bacterium]
MKSRLCPLHRRAPVHWACGVGSPLLASDPVPVARDPSIQIRLPAEGPPGSPVVWIAEDPRNGWLYFVTLGGTLYRLDVRPGTGKSVSTRVAGAECHG